MIVIYLIGVFLGQTLFVLNFIQIKHGMYKLSRKFNIPYETGFAPYIDLHIEPG